MTITLYKCTCAPNVIDKTTYLGTGLVFTNCYFLYGTEQQESPTLILSSASLTDDYNYVYISDIGKYYFITSRAYQDATKMILYTSVDVLYTFKTKILSANSTAYVKRSSTNGSKMIFDDKQSFKYNTTDAFTYYMSPTPISTLSKITTGDPYVMLVYITENWYGDGIDPLPTGYVPYTTNRKKKSGLGLCTEYRLFKYDDFCDFVKLVYNNDTLLGYIKSAYIFPFDVGIYAPPATPPATYDGKFYCSKISSWFIGNTHFTIDCYIPAYYQIQFPIWHYKYTNNDVHFYDYDPYTKYNIWIDYYGWLEIPANRFLNRQVLIYYNLDWETGNVSICARNTGATVDDDWDEMEFISCSIEMCTKVYLSSTNKLEAENARTANVMSTSLSVITGILATAGGIATANPLVAAGGVASIAGGVINGINTAAKIYDTAQSHPTSAVVGANQQIMTKYYSIMICSRQPITLDVSKIGLPYNQYATLNSENGYFECVDFKTSANDGLTTNELNKIKDLLEKGVYAS